MKIYGKSDKMDSVAQKKSMHVSKKDMNLR